ncbi:MAG: leucine-rich repeat domain-containing protein [Marinilabiliaceae bacterium]|nr:leucine-rich repeat domain-containing protein [Marinilabiliaceae bacterium]
MSDLALKLIAKEKKERTGKLDLGNCGLTDFPKELFELTWLEELSFSVFRWGDEKKDWVISYNNAEENEFTNETLPDGFKNFKKLKRFFYSSFLNQWRLKTCHQLEMMTMLEVLDLSDNQIWDISYLENLTELRILDISSNQINDYSVLEKLPNLQSLYLSDNQISDISFLENISDLQSLDLSSVQISDYSFLEKFPNLQSLDLRSVQISDYSFLEKLSNLQTLDLSSNEINDIGFLVQLTNLQSLDLSSNQISDYSILGKLTNLQSLNLSSNQISDYSILGKLTNLQTLKLRSNQICDTSFLEQLTNLQILDLSSNQISNIGFLNQFTKLQTLDLASNQIIDIGFLEQLPNLQSLNLRSNQISNISLLEQLTNLQSLDLGSNQISDIGCLEKLTQLQTLDLGFNQISNISFLEKLTNIQTLDLTSNQISDIIALGFLLQRGISISKDWIGNINIGGNPLTNPPMVIIEKGREAVLDWFDQTKEGLEPLYESKFMVLGQGGAGKTTFTKLQFDPNYKVKQGKLKSTLGIDVYKGKAFPHQEKPVTINAHFWDFGGQDIQKMLHQFFITENCIYALVSDKRAENTHFDYWFQIINLLGPNSSVIVLENPKEVDGATDNFAITKYRELFPGLNIQSVEVNLQHIQGKDKFKWLDLNETIARELSGLEIVNRPVPKKWPLVRNELEKQRHKKYITKNQFYTICEQPEIGLSRDHADLCLYYMCSLGDLTYFDDRGLCSRIFLDHNWLTAGMYYILSDKTIQDNKGSFTRQQAYEKWNHKEYSEEEKEMLFNLLLKDKFDICFELPHEKDVFITPLLLPNDKPTQWQLKTNLHLRYQYGFFPHGMFARLIVKLHEKIEGEHRWKTGMRLVGSYNGDNIRAEVQQFNDPDSNQPVIDIKLNGPNEGCKHLLQAIRSAVENLHDDFKNLPLRELVACNCEACMSKMRNGHKPTFYDYGKLLDKIKHRRYYTDECKNNNYNPVNIGQVLSDIVIENAAKDNRDGNLLHQLKEMGMSINQIKNEYSPSNKVEVNPKIEVNPTIKVETSSEAEAVAKAKAEATNTVTIEIKNLLGKTGSMKKKIERDLKA